MEKQPLGEILVEAGLVSLAQIEMALIEQINSDLKIGEILANNSWIEQKTADFFVEKWNNILETEEKKPLVYYFRIAGLLTKNQVKIILEKQEANQPKTRFHRIAIECGYLKAETVDFFLEKIFNIAPKIKVSFAKPYEILREYIKGQRDFRKLNLSEAPLLNITLKEIVLDESNLRKANLTRINLSHSSLINTNLYMANLAKANLMSVNFANSILESANLQESNLERANFTTANLQNADFTEAYLSHALFAGADLRGAKLSKKYPYEIYYNSKTRFDEDYNPQQNSWTKID